MEVLSTLLRRAYGERPPVEGLSSWRECLEGDLHLWFEAQLPSPVAYTRWLREHVGSRHFIPYVLEAADRESRRTLEGPTHVDALLLRPRTDSA